MRVKLIKSTFYKEQQTKEALIKFILKSQQLSIGKECFTFEENFSKWQKTRQTVLFNSGSSANLALIQALLNLGRLKPRMKIGFSGITWATNVMPLIQLGLTPIPIDVEIETLNVSLAKLKTVHKKEKLDAFFITNLLGLCDNLYQIKKYCEEERILLIEDNCESLGSVHKKINLGNFGLAATFSFFVGHHMSAIEGGAVCTTDSVLARELRMVRSHGWDRHLSTREQSVLRRKHKVSDFFSKYTFYDLAYNLRPTEITGFLANYQLRFLDSTIKKRERNYRKISKFFDSSTFYTLNTASMDVVSSFAIPVICRTSGSFKTYLSKCERRGIEVRPIVGGVMVDQPFFKKYFDKKFDLPNSRLIQNQGFYFGNNPELSRRDFDLIKECFE